MDWIVALALTGVGLVILPMLLRRAKSTATKGSMGGLVMAFGMAFTILLDPAKKAAIESIEKCKDIGGVTDDTEGAPPNVAQFDENP